MRRGLVGAVGLALGVSGLLWPGSVTAAESRPVRLAYEAPAACPDVAAFYLAVRARTQLVHLAKDTELADEAVIRIQTDPGRTVGVLTLPRIGGEPFERRVEAAHCDEVILALSLVLALAYDPDAIVSFSGAPPPAPAPAPAPPAPPAPPTVVVERVTVPATPPTFRVGAGLGAGAKSGVAPGLTPVVAPFVEYGANTAGAWSPAVVAALLWTPAQDITVIQGSLRRAATLRFSGVRVSGCSSRFRLGAALDAQPCLALELGEIVGQGGTGLDSTRSGSVAWAAGGASGNLRWVPEGRVFIQLSATGVFPFTHDQFEIRNPQARVHRIPAASFDFGLGMGVHFP